MREIKFRVWNRELEEMGQQFHKIVCAEDGLEFNLISFKFGRGICFTLYDCLNSSKFIVLQYTGLKDKNGKEIYEGDVIRWTLPEGWQNPFSGDFLDEETTSISEVYFEEGCFMLKTPECGMRTLLFGEFNRAEISEIIGNIYEHPDLLETPK